MTTRSGPDSGSLEVLVVDDEPLLRWVLVRALRARGHQASEAADAETALAAVAGHEGAFDVVLLDFVLPDRRDLSLLAELCHRTPASTVVMMSACTDREMRHAARTLGAWDVVDKPFDVDRLLAMVERSARPAGLSSTAEHQA